jgi:outer membrane usher protein FimD/PapC
MLYLSGVKSGDRLRLHVKWGTAASQQCWANFFVTPTDAPILTGTSQCI